MEPLGEPQLRRITFSDEARENINNLCKQIPCFRNILHGTYKFLQEYAHKGSFLYQPNYYIYITGKQFSIPAFEFFYSIDGENVRIYEVMQAIPEEENFNE